MKGFVIGIVVAASAAVIALSIGEGVDAMGALILVLIALTGVVSIALVRKAARGSVAPAQCRRCGGLVSADAPYCKHCGAPREAKR